jgi:hypothetical protein
MAGKKAEGNEADYGDSTGHIGNYFVYDLR